MEVSFSGPLLLAVHRSVPVVKRVLWAAAVINGLIAVGTFKLATSMDVVFAKAVVEGRVFPYTGEVEEQAFFPRLILVWSILAALVTSAVATCAGPALRRSRLARILINALFLLLTALLDLPLVLWAAAVADDAVSWPLYGWWYVPFLVTAALAHAALFGLGTLWKGGSRQDRGESAKG